ncbi:threonine synthase [Phycisphaera mikurensis]|uniref:Threonine synthase n=1 Tax=Phycisphaera mikurensis (strain NBRC 102666 / KCTC 22515 / FYK2301M01) TaxID=1142394 RepID=I0IAI0_PHYMF|nr:threonine synthase [Phycisphaera mikurensis]MBB6441735.1 threonine synthase [Phycisphaera mikurensis]BAM02268.1 threonine synthase [Phycisphaera mikurensis NBRC 102666]
MRYVSTRGEAAELEFEDVLLEGLARDGGLYVPDAWPTLGEARRRELATRPYARVAAEVMWPFLSGNLERATFEGIVDAAYAGFRHEAVAPLVQLAPNLWVMELFHGPTLAFKDVAMQVLGRLFDHVLAARGDRMTIVGATSGDTGSAAIEAFRDRENCDIFILHPRGRTSDVQRKQMTTVNAANVHNVAIEGTFDDCQDLVKAMFNDAAFRDGVRMSGVNSINWARVMPQSVYYVTAAAQLGCFTDRRPVRFSVPTGNFGDVYAGYIAARMGVPASRLVVASNRNDILTRVLRDGDHSRGEVHATVSPSMDIQSSSNFERLLLDMEAGDTAKVARLMKQWKQTGAFTVDATARARLAGRFTGHRVDEEKTLDTIRSVYADTGYLLDPHTAVGHAAALAEAAPEHAEFGGIALPTVVLATAHPAKFPDAVEKACGVRPPLPGFLADLYEREERFDTLENELSVVQAYIRERTRAA